MVHETEQLHSRLPLLPDELWAVVASCLGVVDCVRLAMCCRHALAVARSAKLHSDQVYELEWTNAEGLFANIRKWPHISFSIVNVPGHAEAVSAVTSAHTLSFAPGETITDLGSLASSCRRLNLRMTSICGDELDGLRRLVELDVRETPIRRLVLPHLNMISINAASCRQLQAVSLGNVHYANFSNSTFSDCSGLCRVKDLDLTNCIAITDVSALSGTHRLVLKGCLRVTDVSSLGNIHDLDLTRCTGITTGIGSLGGVYRLNLSLTHTTDVSALSNVHTLRLERTPVTDVSMLGNVYDLCLDDCFYLTDVSALTNVHSLSLCGAARVNDVNALGACFSLDLSGTGVTDVSALGNLHTLDLSFTRVRDASALGRVLHLDLSQSLVTDLSALHGVASLIRPWQLDD